MMLDEAKIQALLATNTPENQILAMQLIQSQWNWNLSEILVYLVDFYCTTNSREIILNLGNTKIAYILELVDDYSLPMGWDVLLTFEIEHQQKEIKKELVVDDNIRFLENRFLKDYTTKIKAHFNLHLSIILPLLEHH